MSVSSGSLLCSMGNFKSVRFACHATRLDMQRLEQKKLYRNEGAKLEPPHRTSFDFGVFFFYPIIFLVAMKVNTRQKIERFRTSHSPWTERGREPWPRHRRRHPSEANRMAQRQSEAHGDSKQKITSVRVPAGLNSKSLAAAAAFWL